MRTRRATFSTRARAAGQKIEGEDDRALLEADLATIGR
jgi:hypothetical protein